METLLILGAGGHGKVVGEIAVDCGYTIGYLDDKPCEMVIGKIDELEKFIKQFDVFFVAIGNNKRKELTERLKRLNLRVATLIHPTAYVSKSAVINPGSLVEPKALVNANRIVNQGCIISVGSIVDHDSVIDEYAYINAGAICKGGSHIKTGRKLEAGEIVHGFN